MISIKNLSYSYRKGEKIIDDLSFRIPKNSIFGFLGANGAGKTTTIRLMLHLCKPGDGIVLMGGKKLSPKHYKLYNDVGALIETPTFYSQLTGNENLQLLANYYNIKKRRIEEVLEMVGLKEEKNKILRKYSMGMKQRLGIAQSILHNPEFLILDEPLNGLDPKGIKEMRNLFFYLKDEGKTIFISSHLLDEVEKICEHVCIIDNGKKLFEGEIRKLQTQSSKKTEYQIVCDDAAKAAKLLKGNGNIAIRTINQKELVVQTNSDTIISSYIKLWVKEDIDIFSVTKSKNSLEDLFLKLTQNED